MEKIIKCKSCDAEIASSAKVCPKCGAKNKKPLYKKWWFWVIAVIIIASIGGGTSEVKKDKNGEPTSKKETKQEETYFSAGDTITTDKYEIVITGVQTKNRVGTQYLSSEPAEGGIYVCVDLEYKNISSESISAFSLPSVRLIDSNGNLYDPDISASSYYATESDPNRKILSDLNPGIKVRDSKVFEVSSDLYNAGGFCIKVSADKKFTVKIN